MKRLLIFTLVATLAVTLFAQNATNSPYSQYGYGTLADQVNGAAVGMSGLSQGWREGNTVNFGNPASYSGIDSLSFIFDAGISAIMTNFKEGNRRLNATNSSFDYLVAAFRLFPRVGFAFGVMPYSNIGYSYYSDTTIGQDVTMGDTKTTSTETYSGDGGFHQVFIGLGIAVVKTKWTNISIGANASYMWGNYERAVLSSYSDSYVNTLSKYYYGSISSYKVDVSLQWEQRLGKRDKITIGGTYSFGHDLNGKPQCDVISTNSQTGVADTTSLRALRDMNDPTSYAQLRLPTTWAAGFVWNHANRLRIGADWHYELWSHVDYPEYEVVSDGMGNDVAYYVMEPNQFKDRMKFIVGGEYVYNELSRRWHQRIRYRLGASYSTPYLKINGQDGPREYGVSLGIGLPIINAYNNRSILNISASWVRTQAPHLIKENTFRINIGLTFNERWFAKWQVE